MSCGVAPADHEVIVADPETHRRCDDDEVGEIWTRGPSVAAGYWNRPDETEAAFGAHLDDRSGPFLRTGDLGFVRDGELFVAGRLKDLIVIAGANHHPEDIERTVEEAHEAIRAGGSAAFSVEAAGERVVVMAEVQRKAPVDEVRHAISAAVADRHRLMVDGVGLMPPRTAPKTSSGKIRRSACRSAWLSGEIPLLARWESPALRAAAPETAAAVRLNGEADGDGAATRRQLEIEAALVERVVRILGEPEEEIDVVQPMIQLGLGSLEVAEVRASVAEELGIDVPLSRLLDGWSIRDVAREASGQGGSAPGEDETVSRKLFERFVNPAIGSLLRQFRMDKSFVRAEGCWLFDEHGTRYLDAIAGYGAVPFGHSPHEIWQAIRAVGEAAEPAFVQPSSLRAAGELAERLVEVAPPGLGHVTFTNSGAEAAEAAIKLARAATGRAGILSTENGFHGKTLGALSATGRAAYQEPFFAPIDGFELVPFGDLDALERTLAERGEQFAAFMVEPIQGEGGIVVPPAGYLRAARDVCARHGVLFVVDEVQTGLGRTGRMFACDEEGVTPDVLMLAKALGGGVVPVGAVLYGEHVYSKEFALKHTSTFAGGALAARVGLAVLDRLTEDEGALVAAVRRNGERLRLALQQVAGEHSPAVRAVRGRGFLLGLELAGDWDAFGRQSLLGLMAEQGHLAALLSSHLLEVEHVRVAPTILSSDVVRIEPPLTFTEEMCDELAAAVSRSVEQFASGDTAATLNHLLDRPRTLTRRSERPQSGRTATARRPRGGEGRWAFIAHPIEYKSYGDFDHSLSVFSERELGEICRRWSDVVDPFVVGSTRLESPSGAAAYGEFVVVPRTSAELRAMQREEAVGLVREAIALAAERGAQVIGLGGQISVVTGAGLDLGDVGVRLSTGNAFTALSALDTVLEASAATRLAPEDATAGVLGAPGSVGRALSLLLAREFGRLVLVGNPVRPSVTRRVLSLVGERLVETLLAETLPAGGPIARRVVELADGGRSAGAIAAQLVDDGVLVLTADAAESLPLADFLVTATSSTDHPLRPEHLKAGAVVCDIARPLDVGEAVERARPDVLVLEGGLVELPGAADLGWDFGLPPGTAFACMCEPMMFALEQQYELARVGVDMPHDLLTTLRSWAELHGFRPAAFRSFGRSVTEADWSRIREQRSNGTGHAELAGSAPAPATDTR